MLGIAVVCTSFIILGNEGHSIYKRARYQKMVKAATIQPVKVFQIGFSKCGTTTLYSFFQRNGIKAVHHDFGNLALSMHKNAQDGQPMIGHRYENYAVFTDMERMYNNPSIQIGMSYFKQLDEQYPGSKFILNTRNKEKWLKSRSLHPVGRKNPETILTLNARNMDVTEEEVLKVWGNEWDAHHAAVKEYFKDRPEDLIVFNIEEDSEDKLVEFFDDYFVLYDKKYKHRNKTSERDWSKDPPYKTGEFLNKAYKFDKKTGKLYEVPVE